MADNDKTKEQLSYEIAYLRLLNAELEDKHRQSEDVLKVITEQYRRITAALSDYVFSVHIIDGNPVKTIHGPTCRTITGYTPEEFAGNKYLWIQMVHEEDKPAVLRNVASILSGMNVEPFEHRIVRKGGAVRWVRNTPVCQYDARGRLITYDGLIQDITERREAEEALRKSEEKYRMVADFTHDWEYWRGPAGMYIYVSPSCERFTCYRSEEFFRDPDLLTKIVHPDDYDMIVKHELDTLQDTGEICHMDFRVIARDGSEHWIGHVCQSVHRDDGTWLGRRGSNREITKRKRLEEKLRSMTLCDELTGLYNRRGFMTLAEQQLKIASRINKPISLFFADIDGMKEINDTFGHQQGDKALIETAAILKNAFRESDIVARIGGDEFVLFAIETDVNTCNVLTQRIQNRLQAYNQTRNLPHMLSLATGIAHYDPSHPCSLEDLIAQADMLMYQDKQRKHSRGDRPPESVMIETATESDRGSQHERRP